MILKEPGKFMKRHYRMNNLKRVKPSGFVMHNLKRINYYIQEQGQFSKKLEWKFIRIQKFGWLQLNWKLRVKISKFHKICFPVLYRNVLIQVNCGPLQLKWNLFQPGKQRFKMLCREMINLQKSFWQELRHFGKKISQRKQESG